MTQDMWTAVDDFVSDRLLPVDEALAAAVSHSEDSGLPPIAVSAPQGKFLRLLASAIGARRVVEVGTLGAYSTIWLAGALPPDGRLVSIEVDERHAAVARANLATAGLAGVAEVRIGPGLDVLAALAAEAWGPVDLCFIDADKEHNADYVRLCLGMARPGSVIVVDNVVRGGAVLDEDSDDPSVVGTRRLYDEVAAEPRLDATVVQTVGSKGHDGFLLAVVQG
jgi:predicted O-methyltransferase YrrM